MSYSACPRLNFLGINIITSTLPSSTSLHLRRMAGYLYHCVYQKFAVIFLLSPSNASSHQFSNFTGSIAKYISNLSTSSHFSWCVCQLLSQVQLFATHGLQPARPQACPWNSPGKNTTVIAIPFSKGSSPPRDGIQVSHIAGRFFTI